MKICVFIISWEGFHDNAAWIANQLDPYADSLNVIYSNNTNANELGAGNWVKVPNSFYFGRKFKTAIDLFSEGIFLLIHADVTSPNWPEVVTRCREAFKHPEIGVWSPDIDFNPWSINKTFISESENLKNLFFVANTDAIVTAYSPKVVNRLKEYDYSKNHFGWGVDWASVCYAYANNLLVVGDKNIKLLHKKSPGYNTNEARNQMKEFFTQMSPQERIQYKTLNTYIAFKNNWKVLANQ